MNLPERFGEDPKENKGIDLIEEIRRTNRLKLPDHIIGLTEFEKLHDIYKPKFEEKVLSLIKYEASSLDWQEKLKEKVNQLVIGQIQKQSATDFNYDAGFITALRDPEFNELLRLNYNWEKLNIPNDSSNYYQGKLQIENGQFINVVATHLPQMGMVATATSTMKLINAFHPKYIIMTGICAGIEGKSLLGDVIASDLSFDLGSGKIILTAEGNENFEPDYKSIPLSGKIKEKLMELGSKKDVLRAIKDKWQGNTLSNDLNFILGPMGSGAAVIANASVIDKTVQHQRKLTAIDMETYAIFYSCEYTNGPKPIAISIKGVSDFANHKKNDNIQKYASFMSANVADYILKNLLDY